ncbi:tyrosine-protein phosphatase [Lutibacter sp.]
MLSFLKNKKTPLTTLLPVNFVDIHSHILPAVDDGSKSFEESLELLKRMHSFGIKKLVLTPHVMEGVWENSITDLKQRFQELNNYLEKVNFTKIKLHLAAEYMLDANFNNLLKTKKLLTLKDSYLLVEMSYLSAPINLYEILFSIQVAGYKPVLAHPERYSFFHNNYKEYFKLKDVGCLFQLNLLSLSNYYGKDVSSIAKKLLKDNLINFVGSDTHNNRHLNYLEGINSPKIIKSIQPILENNTVFF